MLDSYPNSVLEPEPEPYCIPVQVPLILKVTVLAVPVPVPQQLVSAIKHELLAPLQSLGHQNADIPVAIIPAALLSLLLPFSNLSLSALYCC